MPITMSVNLPPDLQKQLDQAIKDWQDQGNTKRLWSKNAALWSGDTVTTVGADAVKVEVDWLCWLDLLERQQQDLAQLADLQRDVRDASFASAVVLGVGGEVLCARAIAWAFPSQTGFPNLHVLDTLGETPGHDEMSQISESLELPKTLFLVCDKSGKTLETQLLKAWFFEAMKKAVGVEAGSHFLAVTDPGSNLQHSAQEHNFKRIYHSETCVTSPFTALSNFGMVPAAILGIDLQRWLDHAQQAAEACRQQEIIHNPGIHLGLLLGTAAAFKRDKLTLILPPRLGGLGQWIEQLIANSTGKEGKGLIPVCNEHVAPPSHYRKDRLFVYMRLDGATIPELDKQVEKLEQAGHAVIRFRLESPYAIAPQFFLWQVAAVVAASVLSMDPSLQPEQEAARIETKKALDEFLETGKLKETDPLYAEGGDHGMLFFASKRYGTKLRKMAGPKPRLGSLLKAHLDQLKPGDYFAILAYLPATEQTGQAIQFFRHQLRGAKRVATTVGFGTALQHSTGQLFKGGPNTGVFLQITADQHSRDLIPGTKFSSCTIREAQSASDFDLLEQQGRRIARVHLGTDSKAGLRRLSEIIESALKDS